MKTNKGNALTVIVIIIAVLGVGWWFMSNRTVVEEGTVPVSVTSTKPTAKINGKEIELLVADTPETREKGLGGRESLPENTALLFVFEVPAQYDFWMKDMKFPIDIIWLDENFKVIHIESNITPDTYPDETFGPIEKSLYVLEGNALFAQKNNLKIGDVVEIRLNK
jgi:uncharacterized protein